MLSIIYNINSFSDCDPTIDVREVFLNISKAFGKVWHDGILFKLKTYCVKGKLLIVINISARYQRVVFNGQTYTWGLVKSGIKYINDLPDNIRSTCKTFANEASFFPMFLTKALRKMN